MDYRVEELARLAGVRVDTVRYYQSRGLLPSPRREGRVAWYTDAHLERLRRIRELREDGLSLDWIRRVLDRPAAASEPSPDSGRERGADGPLLEALVQEQVGSRTYARAELAAAAGMPDSLVRAAQSAGLLSPLSIDGEERFGEADLEMVRAGLDVLSGGFPLPELLGLAVDHARSVEGTVERAIELFDEHVRKAERAGQDPGSVTEVFQAVLPQVTRLVALHFQRTLVGRALSRLAEHGSDAELQDALEATRSASLEVTVGWR